MNTNLASYTTESGTIIQALVEYDEQYNDYVGFVRLTSLNGNQYVPMEADKSFRSERQAKEFAMRMFARYTGDRK